mmetsp:Transcript_16736/g.23620  ORF Transcript_16736/g.23620 Transcript_16736/m.23620 type:complete len:636 (-) Transcript_16736:203-2110(-)
MSTAENLLKLLQGDSGSAFAASKNGWDLNTDVCNWDGIICNSSDEVVTVSLAKSNLEGTIPDSLGKIKSLRDIYLASNLFSGTVPKSVASLPQLKEIDLSFNKLGGNIPVMQSSSMEVMSFGHNQFTGTLSSKIGKGMQNLAIFDIKYNLVKGTIPNLSHMTTLVGLDLSNNKFEGPVPGFFGVLTNLDRLYLSNNRLDGTIPPSLADSELRLREIFLHGNLLTGTVPAALADLTRLNFLLVDDNKLTGTIPMELCDLGLNEIFFHDYKENVDKTYAEMYGDVELYNKNKGTRRKRRVERNLPRTGDPESERDGCTSIACPAGYKSVNAAKDGVFPCLPCSDLEHLNPYIGANSCFDVKQDDIFRDLYKSTHGDHWTNAQTWQNTQIKYCDKQGVECNSKNEVIAIYLENMNLTGTLPPTLGFLTLLEALDVSGNHIGGKIPSELRFAPLQKLDVGGNVMTGNVPLGLCQKDGVNGNGLDGVYTCDTIACRPGHFNKIGRAEAGVKGEKCHMCSSDTYLGSTTCSGALTSNSITPYGVVGEITILIFAMTLLAVLYFIWQRSAVSKEYIRGGYQNRYAADDAENSAPAIPEPNYLPGTFPLPLTQDNSSIGHNDNSWSSGKESNNEVWLDVPKIS